MYITFDTIKIESREYSENIQKRFESLWYFHRLFVKGWYDVSAFHRLINGNGDEFLHLFAFFVSELFIFAFQRSAADELILGRGEVTLEKINHKSNFYAQIIKQRQRQRHRTQQRKKIIIIIARLSVICNRRWLRPLPPLIDIHWCICTAHLTESLKKISEWAFRHSVRPLIII